MARQVRRVVRTSESSKKLTMADMSSDGSLVSLVMLSVAKGSQLSQRTPLWSSRVCYVTVLFIGTAAFINRNIV